MITGKLHITPHGKHVHKICLSEKQNLKIELKADKEININVAGPRSFTLKDREWHALLAGPGCYTITITAENITEAEIKTVIV